uniref:Transformation related protein 53 target 5 n=1 Tax=Nannospalax galili TaxID=1026970 RepID=A0A8C6R6V7_NANGA
MSPSTRKKPKNRMTSKAQDEKLQDKKQQLVSKLFGQNRLKMVLRNLSLLKLLKNSNGQVQELHSLARRCWNSMLRVAKIFQISSGDNNACKKVKPNNEKFQETTSFEKKIESKKEVIGEPKEKRTDEWKPKERSKGPRASVPRKKKVPPKVPRRPKGRDLSTSAQKKKQRTKSPQVVFLKTYHHRTPMGDMKQQGANQLFWFEGLPTRVHLPGPRVLCRSSTLRWVKRSCTRFCSMSL